MSTWLKNFFNPFRVAQGFEAWLWINLWFYSLPLTFYLWAFLLPSG